MAGRRYIDLVADAESITQVTSIRAFVKRLCNDVNAVIGSSWEWPFLWTTDFFTTVAMYTTGTVTTTNGSATVTGLLTVFTDAMAGRKFRVTGEIAYYTIKSQSGGTTLTLDQPYQGTGASGQEYQIYQDEYLLRADVDQYKLLRQVEGGVALVSKSVTDFDTYVPGPMGTGHASYEIFIGKAVKSYATGTVAMVSGTRSLTGSSTLWTTVKGFGRGTKLKIGTDLFTVNTVTSDTALTTYESAASTISAGTVYTAILDNPVVQLYTIPDVVENYFYRFQRIVAIMDADNDLSELPHPVHPLILKGMLPMLWRHKGFNDRAQTDELSFFTDLQRMIQHFGSATQDRRYRRKDTDNGQRVALAGYPSNYGRSLGF